MWRFLKIHETHARLLLDRLVLLALVHALHRINSLFYFRCLINHHLQICVGLAHFPIEHHEMIVLATCCRRSAHALQRLRCIVVHAAAMCTASDGVLKMSHPLLTFFRVACLRNGLIGIAVELETPLEPHLEVEGLVVDGDGECVYILIVDAYNSAL